MSYPLYHKVKYPFCMFWDTVNQEYMYDAITNKVQYVKKCHIYYSQYILEQLQWNNNLHRVRTLK